MLTERQSAILKIIVEEYIKVPKPVGSKSICDSLNVSSATVRNEMANLEDLGYLEKTHVSSGRVPSEKGYRYYVDNLMKPKEMSGEDVLKLQTIFQNNSLVLSDAIVKSLEIISEMTNYTAVILKDNALESKLKKVEAIPIDENNVTAILVTDKGHVENKIINITGSNLEEVNKTVELINKLNKKSKTENAAIWKDVANRLGRSNRRTAEVNLSDIARYANADETVLVPGKVLSNGDLTEKVNVAAFKFSQKAQEKIESAGGECVSIDDIMESNPKGSNIRIME